MRAVIPGEAVHGATSARVHVSNPAPGGGGSEPFIINLPAPIDPDPEEPGGDSAAMLYLPVVSR